MSRNRNHRRRDRRSRPTFDGLEARKLLALDVPQLDRLGQLSIVGNQGDDNAINLSVLDLPLVEALNSMYFEHDYTEEEEGVKIKKKMQSERFPSDYSQQIYGAGGLILFSAALIPYLFFLNLRVFPFATSASVAWFGTLTAASYYHLVVRRNLRIEQSSRERYQQAMHFVTHEMRTPLSAIQGSS